MNRPRRQGATIVELITVVGIVTLLMALTLPATSALRESARSARCSSNLRQMYSAASGYANLNEGWFPPAILYRKNGPGVDVIAWDWKQGAGGEVSPGPLWEYTGNPDDVQQCPSCTASATFGDDPFTGYNYNTTYIGAEGRFPQLGPGGQIVDGWLNARIGVRPGAWRRLAETAVFGDAGWVGGANKFMRAPMNTVEGDLTTVYSGAQSFRHIGGCNVVFLDGHCACRSQPHQGNLATPALLEGMLGFPANAFLSNDDAMYDPR